MNCKYATTERPQDKIESENFPAKERKEQTAGNVLKC